MPHETLPARGFSKPFHDEACSDKAISPIEKKRLGFDVLSTLSDIISFSEILSTPRT